MNNETMPAAEATMTDEREFNSYELAFHVLPTVAEGEVPGVFETIKALITKEGAEIFDEEAPERFNLAYEIIKHIEGKNRKFTSAYFGWVRFKGESSVVAEINEDLDYNSSILRHIVIKLTKVEEANPFRFHAALAEQKVVTDVDDSDSVIITDVTTESSEDDEDDDNDDSTLDEELEKSETDTK